MEEVSDKSMEAPATVSVMPSLHLIICIYSGLKLSYILTLKELLLLLLA